MAVVGLLTPPFNFCRNNAAADKFALGGGTGALGTDGAVEFDIATGVVVVCVATVGGDIDATVTGVFGGGICPPGIAYSAEEGEDEGVDKSDEDEAPVGSDSWRDG